MDLSCCIAGYYTSGVLHGWLGDGMLKIVVLWDGVTAQEDSIGAVYFDILFMLFSRVEYESVGLIQDKAAAKATEI